MKDLYISLAKTLWCNIKYIAKSDQNGLDWRKYSYAWMFWQMKARTDGPQSSVEYEDISGAGAGWFWGITVGFLKSLREEGKF